MHSHPLKMQQVLAIESDRKKGGPRLKVFMKSNRTLIIATGSRVTGFDACALDIDQVRSTALKGPTKLPCQLLNLLPRSLLATRT